MSTPQHLEITRQDSDTGIPRLLDDFDSSASSSDLTVTPSDSEENINAVRASNAVLSPTGSDILHIPEARDGYFGYSEEKSLKHVRSCS